MNRRLFLKRLGIGVAAATIAAVIPASATQIVKGTFAPGWKFSIDQGPALSLYQLRQLKQTLIARNVHPNMGGHFVGVVHPECIKDIKVRLFIQDKTIAIR